MDKECKDMVCAASAGAIRGMTVKLPIGEYEVKVCPQGLHSVTRDKKGNFQVDTSINVRADNPLPSGSITEAGAISVLQSVVEWFHLYFSDAAAFQRQFPKPVKICVPTATEFQRQVWESLQDRVSVGNTVSYGELATFVDKPKAARAVGSCMKNNPNCIIVPCHRVVRASSDVGNYNGGVDIKIWLLEHEKKMLNASGGPAVSG